jgi:hypothetical protein
LEEQKKKEAFFGGELYNYKQIFSEDYIESHFADKTLTEENPSKVEKSDEKITFDFNWNLESQRNLKNYKLSNQEKRDILKKVRLSFVSHSYLIKVTKLPLLSEFMDLILEAMSVKLSQFEPSNADYSINSRPRNRYVTVTPRVISKGRINI